MMKHLVFAALGFVLAGGTMAQTVSTGAFSFPTVNEGSCMSVPMIFTYNNKPLLTLRDGQDGNGGVSARINVYDENIELVKSFDVKDDLKFYYTLTYKVQQRDVRHVNKTVRFKEQQSGYRNISEWIAEQNRYGNDVSKALSFTRQENGDTLVTVDYDKVEMMGGRTNANMYFAYSTFGLQYPLRYWIFEAKPYNDYGWRYMYQYDAVYNVEYSDWRDAGTKNVDMSTSLSHLYLCNVDLDGGGSLAGNSYFDVSQTLFNTDEDFEYLVPKCALSANYPGASKGNMDPEDVWFGNDHIVTEQTTLASEKHHVVMTGFQVVSSNGSVVKDLDFAGGFEAALSGSNYCAAVITIGGNRYLTFNGWVNGKESVIFFKIDNTSTAIKPLKIEAATMTVKTDKGQGGSSLRVSFVDGNADGSDIVVTSATGQTLLKTTVPAGEAQTRLSLSVFPGTYCVSRLQNGRVCETKKVVLR